MSDSIDSDSIIFYNLSDLYFSINKSLNKIGVEIGIPNVCNIHYQLPVSFLKKGSVEIELILKTLLRSFSVTFVNKTNNDLLVHFNE